MPALVRVAEAVPETPQLLEVPARRAVKSFGTFWLTVRSSL